MLLAYSYAFRYCMLKTMQSEVQQNFSMKRPSMLNFCSKDLTSRPAAWCGFLHHGLKVTELHYMWSSTTNGFSFRVFKVFKIFKVFRPKTEVNWELPRHTSVSVSVTPAHASADWMISHAWIEILIIFHTFAVIHTPSYWISRNDSLLPKLNHTPSSFLTVASLS